jgi:hypothetical protein
MTTLYTSTTTLPTTDLGAFDIICDKFQDFLPDDGICDESVYKKLSTLSYSNYEHVLSFLTKQTSVGNVEPTYSMYKVSLFDEIVAHEMDITANIKNMYHTTVQAEDNFLVLNCLNVDSLCMFLIENTRDFNRYIFIPIIFGTEIHDNGHATLMAFDVVEKKVYLIDPNGKTDYFDNIFLKYAEKNKEEWMTEEIFKEFYSSSYIDSEPFVEKLIGCYIGDLNTRYDLNYNFVSRKEYNKTGKSINKNFKNSSIGSGHCMIISIMIAHFLSTNTDVGNISENFGRLSDDEILQIINSYSVAIFRHLPTF